jgi:hypothetical protein
MHEGEPGGKFKSVSFGEYDACGVKENNTVDCWGDNTDISDVPAVLE